ncbi:MAG: UDP-N-acetylmuramate--L-alanine ligase [Candidatus Eisenbacteria bacterium RBG_16_71_46]|nr:MAG: UDP-N-acetylmuramate--L-alanine ligase [Candidatus Eisenbacteria bacterium RBG_16_71_46]
MYGRTHRIHFIGVGGVGMSGIAEVLLTLGYEVSGSDLKQSETTDRLLGLGGRIFIGHAASNVEGAQVVVHSTAIRPDNVELIAARAADMTVIGRAEMLAELMRMKYGIAVGGAHGKTTTTSMIAAVLARGGLDPTIVVGGRLHAIGSNARLGLGPFLVAEADESDGSFLRLSPAVVVVTNIDREHLDFFSGLEEIRQSFVYFANRVPFYGVAVLCADDEQVREIVPRVTKRALLYGTRPEAQVRGEDLRLLPDGSRFRVVGFGRELGEIELRVPGRHNVLNALAAVAVGLEVEVGFGQIAEALATFGGVSRRFETRGEVNGIRVVDDYAHHPTEIRASLAAARAAGRQVFALFQPHRYSRTGALREEFGLAFGDADRVWVLDIYPAGETPLEGVSGNTVVESARRQGARHVEYAADPHQAAAAAAAAARPGDLVITLGAGDVGKLADEILRLLARELGVAGSKA